MSLPFKLVTLIHITVRVYLVKPGKIAFNLQFCQDCEDLVNDFFYFTFGEGPYTRNNFF